MSKKQSATNLLRGIYAARVYHNTFQSIPDNTLTYLVFNSERFDYGGFHSIVSNTGRLTAPVDGIYQISGQATWAANPVNAQIAFRVNGSIVIGIDTLNANYFRMSSTTLYEMSAGDYVELGVTQVTGGSVSITSNANFSPEFMITLVAEAP